MFARTAALAALAALALPAVAIAQPATKPKLIVAIAIDQLSSDLFTEYRPQWTGGMKRLSGGVVFANGYQSHAATETCPGHATILTGVRPGRAGVIANSWIDQSIARDDKTVYCAEDVTKGATSRPGSYRPSAVHLRVATLGERMKAADPRSRVVAVGGKDRAAIMMGGANADENWFLRPTDHARFETFAERTAAPPPSVARVNASIDKALARPKRGMRLSPLCAPRARPVQIAPGKAVGEGRFARMADGQLPDGKPNPARPLFRASPESDNATLALAGGLIADMRLGRGTATDLIAIGLSATDIVGHAYGTSGSEMCLQLQALDAGLRRLFAQLDRARIDYVVVLTADHGGHDTPERNRERGIAEADRASATFTPKAIGEAVAQAMGLPGSVLIAADAIGDIYIDRAVPAARRDEALARVKAAYLANSQIAAAFTASELRATTPPTLPPEEWTLAQRALASFDPARSGDLIVLLKPRVTPISIETAARSYIATHGSPWDYDRRVPILFWRKGMTGFDQPNTIEVIDIAPTLAGLIGLAITPGGMDGQCRDLDAGAGSTCR
ncbi:MAG: alkaline phosphatase family protein [Sphingomonadaceae bacterium]